MTDVPGNVTTTSSIGVGGTLDGNLETAGDHDWYKITLTAGQKVVISLDGSGASPLVDPYLYIHDSSGFLLTSDDDGGPGTDSRVVFTAPTSGTYYVDVGAWNDQYSGTYTVSVQPYTPPPVYTYDQIADQLTSDYWDGDYHHWDVTQGGSITVNLTALPSDAQGLARAALAEWTDIIGVSFVEVTTGGQITFDDNDDGAYTLVNWSNHIISSAHVNVSTQWVSDYGSGFDGYAFQTYIHEIGHALGLGHAGNYNGDATYPTDAVFANDSWGTTIMSYFSQEDNTYFSDRGFSYSFAETPMVGDILAMQQLYGLSTDTRSGDTIYGTYSNTDNPVYNAASYPNIALTIFDTGGIDTLDYSQFSTNQIINLNPEVFSSVAFGVGNLMIAPGVVIENANGGFGNDTLTGNSADNVLSPDTGNDTVNGRGGSDTVSYSSITQSGVTVNLSLTGAQDTHGAGNDTLISIENIIGTGQADTLTGTNAANVIDGRGGGDVLNGGGGDDIFLPRSGSNTVNGGTGFDTVSYEGGYFEVTADLGAGTVVSRSGDIDTLTSIEGVIGTDGDDRLTGNSANNVLKGEGGADILEGAGGNDTLEGGAGVDTMRGGVGDDTYYVDDSNDRAIENAGEGADTVFSSVTYHLADNVENLNLTGAVAINGIGNSLANRIIGNAAANVLNGGAGADVMRGGLGNDTYYVDNAGDRPIENAGQGNDTVRSSISYSLDGNIENLIITGTAVRGNGNSLANDITGTSGNNIFDGGAGADTMRGGLGDDRYYIDNAEDRAIEGADAGRDRVYTTISLTLDSNLDDLFARGSDAINLTGNSLDNTLRGNSAANILTGGAGADDLRGGTGADTFVFRDGDFAGLTPSTADRIIDFSHSEGDRIDLARVDANAGLGGDQDFTFIGSSAFHDVAGELRYEIVNGNTYVYGDTNGDGLADLMIRLDGSHALTSGDFIVG
jgi:serralysin